jgi:hypothetical protein
MITSSSMITIHFVRRLEHRKITEPIVACCQAGHPESHCRRFGRAAFLFRCGLAARLG